MVNLWVRFEQRFGLVVRVGMEDDNTAGSWKLELMMGKCWLQVRAFQRDDSGGEYNYRQYYFIRNPSSEGSSGDSGREDCSASGHPVLQMGECSTSDYHQEIPKSYPAQLDSGASGSPSLPVAVHSGGDDDYLGSPQNAVSDDSSDDAWLKSNEVLSPSDDEAGPSTPLPAGDSIQRREQFASDYHQETPKSDPSQQDSGASGSPSLPVAVHSDDDYLGSPQNAVSDDYGGVAWLEANKELSLSYYHASPSSSEFSKESFQQESSAVPAQDSPDATNVPHILPCISGPDHPALVEPFDVEPYQLAGLTSRGENVSYYSSNIPRTELSGEVAGMDIDEPFDVEPYQLAGLTSRGENVSYYSSNIPRTELSGEVAGMDIDEVRCKKTGSDDDNLVMGAENAMPEGSSSGTANIMNAGDDLGGSAVAAESEIPQGSSSGNMDEENDDNKAILDRFLDYFERNNDVPPCPRSTDPRDYDRAVRFLKTLMAKGGSPPSLGHNEDFQLCKKIWPFMKL